MFVERTMEIEGLEMKKEEKSLEHLRKGLGRRSSHSLTRKFHSVGILCAEPTKIPQYGL